MLRVTSDPLLRTEHLTRTVDGRAIVDDISVSLNPAEVLAVVGPSGSGKSSFLRLLNRLDEPTAGTVYLQGTDYRRLPPRELRRKMGMVTQRAYLFPGTVADNVGFGPRLLGRDLSSGSIDQLLDQVGLPGYGGRDVANLSGGEAQRVSIARALANSPVLLLLDEPTSALDENAKRGVESLMQQIISKTSLTCVMVTHDYAQAARVARRVLLLQAGRAVRIGSVEEVLHA
jgi:putative ABC transport system ATP-binding protein